MKAFDLVVNETIERENKKDLLKELNKRFQLYNGKELGKHIKKVSCYYNRGKYYLVQQ